MALITVFDDYRNRPRPQFLAGYVSEDGGTVTEDTIIGLTVTDYTSGITYDADDKTITLALGGAYKITVELNQTGGSATFDVYDDTADAVVRESAAGAGNKTLVAYLRTTTAAKNIVIRVDDQSANGTASTAGVVLVERLGKVQD